MAGITSYENSLHAITFPLFKLPQFWTIAFAIIFCKRLQKPQSLKWAHVCFAAPLQKSTFFPDCTFEQGKIMKKNNVEALRKENDLVTKQLDEFFFVKL